VRLIDRLMAETESFHAEADAEHVPLLGLVTARGYRRFLVRRYGFVGPIERSLIAIGGVDKLLDTRRFVKHELLRRDLLSFRMNAAAIDQLPQCTVPVFGGLAEGLGWAFVIERSTLGHTNLFRHLAAILPGEVAFSSSYLKCYFGALGEMWRDFGRVLDRVGELEQARVIDSARTAFRTYRTWRHHQDENDHSGPWPPFGEQQSA
jgi:heme oxygenase